MSVRRLITHEQDLVLVVLLALDVTGHGLGNGSIADLAAMASDNAIKSLERAKLAKRGKSQMVLTDDGRAEARLAAARLARGAS
jgi:hypothetical protein